MKWSPRERRLYVLSILFATAPFAFGLIRLVETGSDLRILWMSLASFFGTFLLTAIAKMRTRVPGAVLGFSVAVLATATLLAAATAYLLGATSAVGVWAVAFVLGLCWASASALYTGSRPGN